MLPPSSTSGQSQTPNQWNTPDWREADSYPKPKELSMTLWRWEFLRRRADYRLDWEEFAKRSYEWDLAQSADPSHESYQKPIPKPDDPEFRASILCLAYESLKRPELNPVFTEALRRYEKYDLGIGLPNPRIRVPPRLSFDAKYVGMIEGPLDGSSKLSLTDTEVMFKYDLSLPLEGQLRFVSMLLGKMQTHAYGKNITRRAQIEKWPLYLRVLDAREQDAPYQMVGEVLLGDVIGEDFDQMAFISRLSIVI
jgi:hypothetical protein